MKKLSSLIILCLTFGSCQCVFTCTGSQVKPEQVAATAVNTATATMQVLLPFAIEASLADPAAREGWAQTATVIKDLILPVLSPGAAKQAPRDSYWGIPVKIYRIASGIVKIFTGYELIELATKEIPKEITESVLHFLKSFVNVIETTLEEVKK